jgi:hypothetical protein
MFKKPQPEDYILDLRATYETPLNTQREVGSPGVHSFDRGLDSLGNSFSELQPFAALGS